MTAIYTAQMAGIDLDELAEEVSSAQNQVDCWAYAKVASMEELRDTHLSRLKEDGGACGGTQFIAHRTVVHWLALIARVCPDRSQEERAGEAACRARRPGRGAADACALTAALLLFTPMPAGPPFISERTLSAGLAQEGRREEELQGALERVRASAAPLPQRLAELRAAVDREAQELARREAGVHTEISWSLPMRQRQHPGGLRIMHSDAA